MTHYCCSTVPPSRLESLSTWAWTQDLMEIMSHGLAYGPQASCSALPLGFFKVDTLHSMWNSGESAMWKSGMILTPIDSINAMLFVLFAWSISCDPNEQSLHALINHKCYYLLVTCSGHLINNLYVMFYWLVIIARIWMILLNHWKLEW